MAQGVQPLAGVGLFAIRRWDWAVRSALRTVFLVVLPSLSLTALLGLEVTGNARPLDFQTFWRGGRAVLHGLSPYPQLAALPPIAQEHSFSPFVYPAPAAVAMVPAALLPFRVAAPVWIVLSAGAVVLALRLLGVRDWRCHTAALGSLPVLSALGAGTISTMLLLGVAVAWRARDRAVACGCAVAAVAVAKLFLWPLGIWLVCTRRYRAAAVALATGAAATAAGWLVIGFAGADDYATLLSRLTRLVGPNSYSLYALGVPEAVTVGAALVLLAWSARRDERTAFLAAVAAALVATPILWPHYLVLLFVPLALSTPGFTLLWMAPTLLWLDARPWSYGQPLRILPELALAAAVFVAPALVGARPAP